MNFLSPYLTQHARLLATLSTVLASQCSVGCLSCVLIFSGLLQEPLFQDMVIIFIFLRKTRQVQTGLKIAVNLTCNRYLSLLIFVTHILSY